MICIIKYQFNIIQHKSMKLIQTIFIMLLGFVIKANPQSTTLNQGLISTMENPNIQLNLYQVSNNQTPNQNHNENNNGTDHGQSQNHQSEEESHYISPSDPEFIQTILLALFLTICGAFCSGMGVGLLSISKLQLRMMLNKQNERQVTLAKMILRVVQNHHLFLVTLLLANAIALESLPLVIHLLMPDWLAIIFSTIIVLIVAEIIPQAVCTGAHKLTIAYYASPIILVMIKLFWIVGYPTAKLLDFLVGDQHEEKIQHKDFANFLNDDKFLKSTQKMLLTSTLQLRGDRVHQIMIPVDKFFMLQENELITEKIARKIYQEDYSYILVFKEEKTNIVGCIKVKEFSIKYLSKTQTSIVAQTVMKPNADMLTVYQDTNLLEMLMLFQAKSTRIALVCSQKRKIDPSIQSIMYSKSDMIYKKKEDKGVQIIGVIYLYQIFNNMAEIKEKIQRQSRFHLLHNQGQQQMGIQLGTLKKPLLK